MIKITKDLKCDVTIDGQTVTVDNEIEIDISLDDLILLFEESKDLKTKTLRILKINLNQIAIFLKGIPDSIIKEMHPETKKLVIDFLEKTKQRFEE